MNPEIKIEYLPLVQIKLYENNPRRNEDAVDAVAASIREFGFKVPIVIDANDVCVTGDTRYRAAVKLGLCDAPCIRAEHLTPEQVKAFRLADNKTGEIAEWDDALLQFELNDLASVFDMSKFGFSLKPAKQLVDTTGGTEQNDDDVIICPKCKRPFSRKEGRHRES